MNIFLLILITFVTNLSHAQREFIPSPIKKGRRKFVFVDFTEAKYQFLINQKSRKVKVRSTITFNNEEKGYPLIDFSIKPENIILNGKSVKSKKIRILKSYTRNVSSPFTFFRGIKKMISPGTHTLEIVHELKEGVTYEPFSIRFWYWDLVGKHFLNKYLPTNLEFDQYTMTMEFKSSEELLKSIDIQSNALSFQEAEGLRTLIYPKYLSSSSIYLHLHQKNKYSIQEFSFVSKENKIIPIRVYSKQESLLNDIQAKILKELTELESVFGPWPHPNVLVYLHPKGTNHNYEYAGAFESTLRSLSHEIFHGYFSRAMTPADGNSGWIDEAIAEWRDSGYPKIEKLSADKAANLACHHKYRQRTVKESYTKGRDFISHLDYLFAEKKLVFSEFLKQFLAKYKYKVINTSLFMRETADYYGEDLKKKFCFYVCNKASIRSCKL